MSANSVRRHHSVRNGAVDLGRRRTDKVLGLLALRDRLARAAAEYEAHDFDGALDVFQQQLDVESAIQSLAPDLYESRWTQWLEQDAALAHDGDTQHPNCGYCQLREQRAEHLAWPPQAC